MPKKTKIEAPETEPTSEEQAAVVKAVTVIVRREHCITPHSIELRKNDDGIVIDARTEDWKHIYTIGAKTVEAIFAEVGHEIPVNDTDELEIVFSPYNGEVVAIQPKAPEDAQEIDTQQSSEDDSDDDAEIKTD